MRNTMLALALLCATPAQALQQPFFDLFDQRLQRVSFGLKKPTFTGELQHYGTLYRGTSWYPGLSAAAYLPVFAMLAVGVGFGLDWYQDSGVAVLVKGTTIRRDEGEETQLMLVPARVMLLTAFKPLGRWVSFDFGLGFEYLYGQESRTSSSNMGTNSEDEDTAPLLNKGWQAYRVISGGIDISLHILERQAMRALQRSFSITDVYLSLTMEWVQIMRKRKADFSRNSLALGIMFEAG